MYNYNEICIGLQIENIAGANQQRHINAADINLPKGYQIEAIAIGLEAPTCFAFDMDGSLLIAESGLFNSNARILRFSNGNFVVVADGFKPTVMGVNIYKGLIYVSHKGFITTVKADGSRQNIIMGLPSNGDYGNGCIAFGPDGKMYFGQGTVTNSGIVGLDNDWVYDYPFTHDYPGSYIMLSGQNFPAPNILAPNNGVAYTGAYSPFGEANSPFEVRKGAMKASGSILRANPDGSDMEQVTWGFRNPGRIRFDHAGRLFAANQAYDNRGSRPVVNAPDEFLLVNPGTWYGWPDFAGGQPLTDSRFWPEGGKPLEFLMTSHPSVPDRPFAIFPPDSAIMGFDFCYSAFGPYGSAYIAEFGSSGYIVDGNVTPYAGMGHRVSRIDMGTGGITTFAINKSGFSASYTGEGGFGRPIDVIFGPDQALYILDFGMYALGNPEHYIPNSGVIWKVTKTPPAA